MIQFLRRNWLALLAYAVAAIVLGNVVLYAGQPDGVWLHVLTQEADSVTIEARWNPVTASDGRVVETYLVQIRESDDRPFSEDWTGRPNGGGLFWDTVQATSVRLRVGRTFAPDTTFVAVRVAGMLDGAQGAWNAVPYPVVALGTQLVIPPVNIITADTVADAEVASLRLRSDNAPPWDSILATDPDVLELWSYADVLPDDAPWPHLHPAALGQEDCYRMEWGALHLRLDGTDIGWVASISTCLSYYADGHLGT